MKIYSSQLLNKGQNISSISINSSNSYIAISEIDITIHKISEIFSKTQIEEEVKMQVDIDVKINLKDERKKDLFQINDNDSPVNVLKFLNNRLSNLVTGGSDRLLKVYSLNYEKKIYSILKTINLGSEIIELQVATDDSYIICSVLDGYVFIIQSSSEGKIYNICGKINLNEELCYSISISKLDSSQFTIITESGRVEIYDVRYSESNGLHEIQRKRKNIFSNEGSLSKEGKENKEKEGKDKESKAVNKRHEDESENFNSSSSFKKITWGVNNMIISSNYRSILKGEVILNYCKVYEIITDVSTITRSELLVISSSSDTKQEKDLINIYSNCLIGFNHEVTILQFSEYYYKSISGQGASFLLLLTGDIYGNLTIWKVYDNSYKKNKFHGQCDKYCHINSLCDASFSCFEFDKTGRFLYISNITGMVIIVEFLNITPIKNEGQAYQCEGDVINLINDGNEKKASININPVVKRKIAPTMISQPKQENELNNEQMQMDVSSIYILYLSYKHILFYN